MRRGLPLAILAIALLAACSGGGGTSGTRTAAPEPSAPVAAGQSSSAGSGTGANAACSGGLTGNEPGVLRITCDGTAVIRIRAGAVTREFHGGACHSAGDVWSAAAGVVIDETGVHGTYTGPAVDSVAVNNTATAGFATIQAVLGGKHYFDLGTAKLTLSADRKTAHIAGTSDRLSDAPSAQIAIDVTC